MTVPSTVAGSERSEIAFDITVTDPDGDAIATLTADLSKLPPANSATFTKATDLTSGHFAWTPTFFDSGEYDVSFAATNTLRSNKMTTRVVVQGAVDHPPTVTAPASLSGTTGEKVEWMVVFDDADGDGMTDMGTEGIDSGGGLGFGQPHFEVQLEWQACKPGVHTAVVWASSGSPAQSDTAWTEITVTGTADHYIDFLGGTDHFEPDTLVIQAGETIAWRSMDGQPHSLSDNNGMWNSGWIKPGCTSRIQTFTAYINPPQPRTYQYHCHNSYHSSPQIGVIIVNP